MKTSCAEKTQIRMIYDRMNMKNNIIKTWLPIALSVILIAGLFMFRDALTRFGSRQVSQMQEETKATIIADSIKSVYDYSKGESKYQYTFLEFGAKGCLSCRKMEKVMEEVKQQYPTVNVRFLNVTLPNNQEWTNYFGVVMIPTQIILDKTGHEIFRHTGYIPIEDLEKKLK